MRSLLPTLSLLSLLLLLAVPLSAQEAKQLSQEQLEAIAIQPASNWGKGDERVIPEMLALFKEESIQHGGITRKYLLYVPENIEPGKKYPMILWLHGAGEAGNDNKSQLIHLHHIITYLAGEKKRDFFLLVPQCFSTESWRSGGSSSYTSSMNIPTNMSGANVERMIESLTKQTRAAQPGAKISVSRAGDTIRYIVEEPGRAGPLEPAFAMVEQVADEYPVDKNRITVSGLSTGGDGTWYAIERRPDLFAAGAPLANWVAFSDKAMEEAPILKKIPVWSIYSSDDNSIDRAREEFARVENAGANVKKTEFGICGHTAWTPAMLQADIFAWLLSRAKDGDRFYAVYDPGVDPDQMKGIIDVATRDPGKPTLAPAVEKPPVTPVPFAVATPTAATDTKEATQAREAALAQARARIEAQGGTVYSEDMIGFPTSTAPMQPIRLSGMESGAVQRMVLPDGTEQSVIIRSVHPAIVSPEKEKIYVALAERYFLMVVRIQTSDGKREQEALNAFKNCFKKISLKAQWELISKLLEQGVTLEALKVLEELLDGTPGPLPAVYQPTVPPNRYIPTITPVPQQPVMRLAASEPTSPPRATTISAEKIIEECNRPWAMTSESLYGMFAADWDKEAVAIPDFVVNSDTDTLAKTLAKSIGEDPESKDFVAACRSILSLTNKPMSSPWFETSGGRLRSDIQYSLSSKGQMFARFLRVVADSGSNSDKAKELSVVAKKTLEKIEMVLAK